MALFKLKPDAPEPAAPLSPCVTSLRDHLHRIGNVQEERAALLRRDAAAATDQNAEANLAAQLESLRGKIDLETAASRYEGTAELDFTQANLALAQLEKRHRDAIAQARAAKIIRQRYSAEIAQITERLRLMTEATPRFLFEALRERLAGEAAEFLAAERKLKEVHRAAFAAALAADGLAREHHFGEFLGSVAFGDLKISRPATPEFDPHHGVGVEERQQIWVAEQREAEQAASNLVHDMMTAG